MSNDSKCPCGIKRSQFFSLLIDKLILSFPSVQPAKAGDTGETWVIAESEDPMEKEMAIHSSILTWKISWI